jgi:hypothetical protein
VADAGVARMFGVDLDHPQHPSLAEVARRRYNGHYTVDPFGADPQLQDLIAPLVVRTTPVRTVGVEHLPEDGPALLVANRGSGVLEPTVLSAVVRQSVDRRLRVVGAPDLPIIGDLMRKLGSVGAYPGDVAALLRMGQLAVLPLAPHWLRSGEGNPPTPLLEVALGYPVIPVLVRPGGPLGLPLGPWRVTVGTAIEVGTVGERDPLLAAELVEQVRNAVHSLR